MTIAEQLHDDHLRRNLELVRRGVKNRAAGIRRCRDCSEPFIVTFIADTPHSWCEHCRTQHTHHCATCQAPYPIDEDSSGLCPIHRVHPILF